ncbi:hypothetical protein HID58_067048, partial [Brassica napus]
DQPIIGVSKKKKYRRIPLSEYFHFLEEGGGPWDRTRSTFERGPGAFPSGDPEAGVLPGIWRNSIPDRREDHQQQAPESFQLQSCPGSLALPRRKERGAPGTQPRRSSPYFTAPSHPQDPIYRSDVKAAKSALSESWSSILSPRGTTETSPAREQTDHQQKTKYQKKRKGEQCVTWRRSIWMNWMEAEESPSGRTTGVKGNTLVLRLDKTVVGSLDDDGLSGCGLTFITLDEMNFIIIVTKGSLLGSSFLHRHVTSKALLYSANASSPLDPTCYLENDTNTPQKSLIINRRREKEPDIARWEASTPVHLSSFLEKNPRKARLQKEIGIISVMSLQTTVVTPITHQLRARQRKTQEGPTGRNLSTSTDGETASATTWLEFLTSTVRSREEPEESVDSDGPTLDLCFFDLTLPPMEEESRARFGLDFILEIQGGTEGRSRKKKREKEREIIPENGEPSSSK